MQLLELPDKHTQRMSPPDPCGVCHSFAVWVNLLILNFTCGLAGEFSFILKSSPTVDSFLGSLNHILAIRNSRLPAWLLQSQFIRSSSDFFFIFPYLYNRTAPKQYCVV